MSRIKILSFDKALSYISQYDVEITSIRLAADVIKIAGFVRNRRNNREYHAWIIMSKNDDYINYHCTCPHHLYTHNFCKHLAMLLLEASRRFSSWVQSDS